MPDRVITVFLSSTGKDLADYRRAVMEHMRRLDRVHCDAMEYFGAREAGAFDFCRERAAGCDVFVGLVGHTRG